MIMEGEPFLDWKTSYQLGKLAYKMGDIRPRVCFLLMQLLVIRLKVLNGIKVLTIEENFSFG